MVSAFQRDTCMIKVSTPQTNIAILYVYASNNRATGFIKKKL
jgi:hypothetical protein